MIIVRNIFFVSCVFGFILLLFSFIPSKPWNVQQNSFPVYHQIDDHSDQLVSFLVTEAFSLKIKKVEADSDSLIVDFIVKDKLPTMRTVYTELANLVFKSFNSFSNYDDIRVRILVSLDNKESVLIGVLARRDQYKPEEVNEPWKLEQLVAYLKNNFQVSYGSAWLEYNQSSIPK